MARIHDATRHCNWRKQWVKPSHLTELDVLSSVLALLNAFIGMFGLWFQCYGHLPMIRHQLKPFWANLDSHWTSSLYPERCPCNVVFAQSLAIFASVIINRTALWQEFMMHYAIAIEDNSEQNLHIWPNLMCFFRSWLFWTLPLGWLGFRFYVIAIWENLDRRWTPSTPPERCPCDVIFAQNFAILEQSSLRHISCLKHP